MNIVLATDENYARFAATVISSLVRIHPNIPLNICVLDSGMSEESRARMQGMSGEQFRIHLYNAHRVQAYANKINPQRDYTAALFSRLLIPDILPNEQRAIYLDSDVLVLRCLHEIYQGDMGGKALCMVRDIDDETHSHRLSIPRYFNSGVILFNLERCRQLRFTRRWLEYLDSVDQPFLLPDQDVINVVSQQEIGELPSCCNSQFSLLPNGKTRSTCPNRDQVAVVHFIGVQKPWSAISHPFGKLYLQAMLTTPWASDVSDLRRRKRLHYLRCCLWDRRRYVSDDREKMRTLYVLGIPIFSRYKSPTRRILYFLGIPFFIWHYPVRKPASPH